MNFIIVRVPAGMYPRTRRCIIYACSRIMLDRFPGALVLALLTLASQPSKPTDRIYSAED